MAKDALIAIYRSASKLAVNQHSIALGRRDAEPGKSVERTATSKETSHKHGKSASKARG